MWKTAVKDKGTKKALSHYLSVLEGKEDPNYFSADLEAKIKEAEKRIEKCDFCQRKCGVNRKQGEKGDCGVGYQSRVSSAFQHRGEERILVPSGTIFFSGCNFHCVYCQNHDISQNPEQGEVWSPKRIAEWIEGSGCINMNFVGGEPTPNLHWILRTLKECRAGIPVVWNSNMYMSQETMELLEGVVDVYLADFRYGNDKCALKYSSTPNYIKTVTRNFLMAEEQAEVLIRLLVLPGHVKCCDLPIIEWIADNLGNEVRTNIMSQYRPVYRASEFPGINRRLTPEEYREVVGKAKEKNLWNVELQGL